MTKRQKSFPHIHKTKIIPLIILSIICTAALYSFYHQGLKDPIEAAIGQSENGRLGGDFWASFPSYFVEKYNPVLRNKTIVKNWEGRGTEWWHYGPIEHLLTLPLTLFTSIRIVATIWLIINYIFLAFSIFFVLRILEDAPLPAKALVAFLWLGYWPLHMALQEGVIEIFELFMITGSLYLLYRGRDRLAGVALGIAGMAKFLPLLFLAYFAMKRKWKAFFAMALTVGVIAIATQLTIGWQRSFMMRQFFEEVGAEKYDYTIWRSQTVPSAVERIFSSTDYSPSQIYYPVVKRPVPVKWSIRVIVGGMLLLSFYLIYRNRRGMKYGIEYGIMALLMFLASPHGEHYYLIFGLIGFSFAVYYLNKKPDYFLAVILSISYFLCGYIMQMREFDRILLPDYTDINRTVFFLFLSFPTYGAFLLFLFLLFIYKKDTNAKLIRKMR